MTATPVHVEPRKTSAERIEEVAADAERYSQGLLSASVVRTYERIGADCVLHDLSMQLIERFGTKRHIRITDVMALICEQRKALDAMKERTT